MARTRKQRAVAERVLESPHPTVLDLLDDLLSTGVVATGDVTLGVAGVDLIYLRLSTLLCASDRVRGRRSSRRRSPVASGRRRLKS